MTRTPYLLHQVSLLIRFASMVLLVASAGTTAHAQQIWQRMIFDLPGSHVQGIGFDTSGGIHISTDLGNYHRGAADQLWRARLWSLGYGAVAPGWNNSVYVTADRRLFAVMGTSATSWAVHRSDDTGRTWKPLPAVTDVKESLYLRLGVGMNGTLLATSHARLQRSSDNGATWDSIPVPEPFHEIREVGEEEFIATGGEKIYRSFDDGRTWRFDKGIFISGMVSRARGIIYATRHTTTADELVRTTDKGYTWTLIRRSVPGLLAVAPNGDVWITDADSLLMSTDRGATWSVVARLDAWAPNAGMVAEAPDRSLVSQGNGGLFRSIDDGDNWKLIGSSTLAGIDSAGWIYSTAAAALHVSTNLGETWEKIATGITSVDLGRPIVHAASFGEGPNQGVWVSRFGGSNWIPTTLKRRSTVVAITPMGTILAGAQENGAKYPALVVTADTGTTWRTAVDSLEVRVLNVADNGTIHILGRRFLTDQASGNDYQREVYLRSTDEGRGWETIVEGLPVHSIFLTRSSGIYMIDGDTPSERIRYSSDNGTTWDDRPRITPGVVPVFMAELPDGSIVARSAGKLYRTIDNGTRWSSIQFDLPGTTINSVMGTRNGYLFAATDSGLFRATSGTVDVREMAATRSAPVLIGSPRPNPMSTTATLPLALATPGHLRITLCDLLGRELRVLGDGLLPAGPSIIELRREDLPAGIYLLRIRSEVMVETRTVVVD